MGKLTINMVIFNSYVTNYQRVVPPMMEKKTLCRWVILLPVMVDTGCGWRSRFSQVPGKRKRGTSSWKITRSQAPRYPREKLRWSTCRNFAPLLQLWVVKIHRWIQAPQWEDGPFRAETLAISDQLECRWVCLKMSCTPKNPMVLLIIIPTKWL